MAKMIVAALTLGVVGLMQLESGRAVVLPNAGDLRNLLLNAAGTRTPKPGQIRVPVWVDGVAYEVIVQEPGEPRFFRVWIQ